MPKHLLPMLVPAVLMTALGFSGEAAPTPEQVQFFEGQVRPVLVNECAKCHDAKKHKGGLRVDSRASLLAGGDSGPAVVPGKPDESVLIAAVNHEGPEMPPSGKLPKPKIEALTQWVKMGAPWPGEEKATPPPVAKKEYQITEKDRRHWAFQPIKPPPLPVVKDRAWVASPIDAFILAGLERKGLAPNAPASKLELIRRASYDLTGLPPSPEDVERFLADSSPLAYEALIDRLLDSPRYGEKWGRHWLDLVRFAETNSYERDGPKPNAWRYRDYVIGSFNQDKPYDRFVHEQLAGDEIPGGGADALIATGYYRLGIWDDEPTDREQARYDGLDDIVATTAQVFFGLTVDCARCHDHKIDPIPQKDYYRLLSFFQNVYHYTNGSPADQQPLLSTPQERERYDQALQELERRRNAVQAEITEIENIFRQNFAKRDGGKARQPDLDDLRYRYYRDTWEKLPDFNALKPEDSGVLPRQLFDLGPRTRDDAFGFVFEGVLIVPKAGTYTFYLDSDDGSRLIVGDKTLITHDGIHGEGSEQRAETRLEAGRLPIRLEYFQRGNGLGLTVSWSGPGVPRRMLSAGTHSERALPQDVTQLIRTEGNAVLGVEKAQRYRDLRRELRKLVETKAPVEMALCVSEAGPRAPDTFVLARGNAHVPGDKVEPGFLSVLGAPNPVIPAPPPGARSTGRRTVLADWITAPDNPLTPRVLANRVWQYHFGRGIVRSPSNFGTQGDRPTHPELLDWLAAELLREGWRLKPLHRLIMTSNAYRMSSRGNSQALAMDPTNDLFWRFDMRRLTAEEIRDSIHAISGTLNLKMYGPGFYSEIPREVMAGQSVPGSGWGKSPPEEVGRRSVYIHVKRSLVTPILESFDQAELDRSSPVRFATTQPTQALAMLNSVELNKQAALFAARLQREAGDDRARQVDLALRLATSRAPTEAEIQRGAALIEDLKTRDGLPDDAALKSFCLVVLNLNEFVYLDQQGALMSQHDSFCGRTRREFLWEAGAGFTGLALTGLLGRDGFFGKNAGAAETASRSANPLAPKPPMFAPKAKSVIFLFMYGGPSHVDTFDYKPTLYKLDGQTIPIKTFGRGGKKNEGRVVGPKWKFKQYGESGKWVSDLFPHLATCVDDIAFLHSMTADSPIHGSAMLQMNTGKILSGSPCLGSWVNYGLGSENEDLPGFVVMLDPTGGPISGAKNWSSGYMPATYQGTILRSAGDPILDLKRPEGLSEPAQRRLLDTLGTYNNEHLAPRADNSNLAARIASYELAFAMQRHAPGAVDLTQESAATQELYGLNDTKTQDFGRRCLLARRLVERGVRFVQLYSGGAHNDSNWDAHGDLETNHNFHAGRTDKPIAALLIDLKRRGLLDETLVIWGGEFGRQPTAEYAKGTGRDHNAYGFTMWMAGGGIKGGVCVGETDELGASAVSDRFHVKNLHATVLQQLGMDPNRLAYFYNGLDQKLVGVEGAEPIKQII